MVSRAKNASSRRAAPISLSSAIRAPAIRILPHANMFVARNKDLPAPDLIVVDERFWRNAVVHTQLGARPADRGGPVAASPRKGEARESRAIAPWRRRISPSGYAMLSRMAATLGPLSPPRIAGGGSDRVGQSDRARDYARACLLPEQMQLWTHGNETSAPRPDGSGTCWRRSISIPSARCSGSCWNATRRHATATVGTCCTCTIAVR